MKTVLDKNEVAHRWANQLQSEGRTAGRNFYFHGDTIYSYGGHFPIAKHVTNKKGERAILFTFRGYSNTTAKQIHVTRMACSHKNIILVDTPTDLTIKTFDGYINKIKSELKGLGTARKPEKYIDPAMYYFGEAKKYADFFGLKLPKELIKLIDSVNSGEYKQYLIKEADRIAKEKAKREKEHKKQFIESIALFRSFEVERLYNRLFDRDYLRYNPETKRVETSQGVEIPTEAARRAYNWIKETVKAGGCNGECSYKILDYEVKSVTPELVTIGCHKIDLSEIEQIAVKLGW